MDGETGQTNFFDFDLSGYDFYGMTNEEIQDLFNKFNSELGIKRVFDTFHISKVP